MVKSGLYSVGSNTDLKLKEKKSIAKEISQHHRNVSSWLHCLTILRNSCAHYSRLYFKSFPTSPADPNGQEPLGESLFDYMRVMKYLHADKDKWNNTFVTNISSIITEYSDSIKLEHIGFPLNWKQQLIKQ